MTRPRYLAITPSPDESGRQHINRVMCAEGLVCVFDQPELLIYLSPGMPRIVLPEDRGIILGHLFRRDGGEQPDTLLSPAQAMAVAGSAGEILVTHYWGGYLALLRERSGRSISVLRDPSGGLTCYACRHGAGTAIASDVALLESAGLYAARLDEGALARHLLATQLRRPETCLTGLSELPRGSRWTLGPNDNERRPIWNPWRFAGRDLQIRDAEEAVTVLRRTVCDSIAAWAGGFDHILLSISGGLDSSIVAAGLHAAGADFSCITLFTDDPSGDERDHARMLAAHLGVSLAEERVAFDQVDLGRSDGAHQPRPIARGFAQAGDRRHLAVAEATGARAFFNGGGGDNVFCNMHSMLPLVDRIRDRGGGAWRTALDLRRLTGCGWLELISGAKRRMRLSEARYDWKPEVQFLAPELVAAHAQDAVRHPWLEAPDGALAGSALHIAMLLRIENHLEGFRRELSFPVLSPLMSQPLIELCLRIPSWMWCEGGVDRAVARRAFADALPLPLLARRSHGTPASLAAAIYRANRPLIRDMLSEGYLARQGMLDLPAIHTELDDPGPLRDLAYLRILALVDAEAWIRSWSDRGASASRSAAPVAASSLSARQ